MMLKTASAGRAVASYSSRPLIAALAVMLTVSVGGAFTGVARADDAGGGRSPEAAQDRRPSPEARRDGRRSPEAERDTGRSPEADAGRERSPERGRTSPGDEATSRDGAADEAGHADGFAPDVAPRVDSILSAREKVIEAANRRAADRLLKLAKRMDQAGHRDAAIKLCMKVVELTPDNAVAALALRKAGMAVPRPRAEGEGHREGARREREGAARDSEEGARSRTPDTGESAREGRRDRDAAEASGPRDRPGDRPRER